MTKTNFKNYSKTSIGTNLKLRTFFLSLIICFTHVQSQNATWMKGSGNLNAQGKYGTLGVASVSNNPGGREFAATWQDASGNLWLFGGLGIDAQGNEDFMNDLWKYNPSNNQWTWIKGDSVIASIGIYGTQGVSSSSNMPGARGGACTWQDATGNFWLFGGDGYDAANNQGELGDLWKYNPSNNQWTWMKGSNSASATAVYGTIGQSASANLPGSRYGSYSWKDGSGNFWLFGGSGYDASSTSSYLNDLWKYNPQNNQWTWINGSNVTDQYGVYGIQGTASPTVSPGGRFFGRSFTDANGNFWLFGGVGFAASGTDDLLNDLWSYNPVSNQWTWMNGSNLTNQIGKYGTLGVPNSSNTPGGRVQPLVWMDPNNQVIVYGGYGNTLNNINQGDLSDFWSLNTSTGNWTWIKGSTALNAKANFGTQSVLAATNKIGSVFDAMVWQTNANTVWLFGGFGFNAAAGTVDGYLHDMWRISPCVQQTISVTSNPGQICSKESATLTVQSTTTFSWSGGQTGTVVVVSPTITTAYSVSITDGLSCPANAGFNLTVNACAGLTDNLIKNTQINIMPNPNNGQFKMTTEVLGASFNIYNTVGQCVYKGQITEKAQTFDLPLNTGLYYYQVELSGEMINQGKILVE